MMNIGNQQQSQLVEETLHAAARILCQAALDLIEKDPHQWSKRPCTTCQTVSVQQNGTGTMIVTWFFPGKWSSAQCEEWGALREWFVDPELYRGWNGTQFWFTLSWSYYVS